MYTRKSILVGLLAMALLLLSACGIVRGSGTLVTETRNVSGFDRVDLSGSGEVIITQGAEESLTVETDDNLMQYIISDVRGRTLHLGMNARQFNIVSPTRLRFTLQVRDLSGLDVSGSGSIEAETVTTERLDLDLSGSGAVQIGELVGDQVYIDVSGSGTTEIDELTADNLRIKVSGSGNVQAAGEVAEATFDISGSGNVRAGDLRSDIVDVKIAGSGATTVWAVETLDADLSGSGSVRYYGNPSLNSSTSGSGTVNSLGRK